MISRLRPIDVSVSFDDRDCKLGESIDVTVQMKPNRDCHVREGRIDLMVEERWTERSTLTVDIPIIQSVSSGFGGSAQQMGTTTEIRQVVKDHKETSPNSSVVFLEAAHLSSGRRVEHRVRLEVRTDTPTRTGDAKVKWWLQTVLDVAGARDIKPRQKVKISAL